MMPWIILLVGITLWAGAHLFKRIAPERRAEMGDKGKGLIAGLLFLSIILMVLGYRGTGYVTIWQPPYFFVHVNNLLVLLAIFLMTPAAKKGKLLNGMRHPMLTGFGLWAFAHLLVKGDLASVFLFGGLMAWAVAEIVVINRAEPEWAPAEPGTMSKDAMFAAGSVIFMVVIGYIHNWLGVWPFG